MERFWFLLYWSAIGIPILLIAGLIVRFLEWFLEFALGYLEDFQKWMEDPREIPISNNYQSNQRLIFPVQFGLRGFMKSDIRDASTDENRYAPAGEKYAAITLGEPLLARYQILGKVGWGETASAWLARDLLYEKYVVAKMYKRHRSAEMELVAFDKIEKGDPLHFGQKKLRERECVLNHIRNGGDWHETIVQKALGSSLTSDMMFSKYDGIIPTKVIKSVAYQVLLALDYLHNECNLIHTGVHGENVFLDKPDDSIIDDFVRGELRESQWQGGGPDKHTPYSGLFGEDQDIDGVKLGGLGGAVDRNVKQKGDSDGNYSQHPDESFTRFYRAPEMYFEGEYGTAADIWSLGCWIYELVWGDILFDDDRVGAWGYQTVAWSICTKLGPPPRYMQEKMAKSRHFDKAMFGDGGGDDEEGYLTHWWARMDVLEGEERLGSDESWDFFDLMKDMVQWRPEDRKTTGDLLMHPWFKELDLFYTRRGLDPELCRKPERCAGPEQRPKSEQSPKAKRSPKVEQSLAVKQSPEVKQSPKAKHSLKAKQNPKAKQSPKVEHTPEVEQSPAVKQSPDVKLSPEVKLSQEVKLSPEVEESPKVEESPEVEPIPKVEQSLVLAESLQKSPE